MGIQFRPQRWAGFARLEDTEQSASARWEGMGGAWGWAWGDGSEAECLGTAHAPGERSCPQPRPHQQGARLSLKVTETYHAGVDCSLLNVPCNACDKRIPVLEVCVKVSLRELENRNMWWLENRSKAAGCPGNKLLPTNAQALCGNLSPHHPLIFCQEIPPWIPLGRSWLQPGPASASHG